MHSVGDHFSFAVCAVLVCYAALVALVACYDQIYTEIAVIDPTYYQDDFGTWHLFDGPADRHPSPKGHHVEQTGFF